MAVAAAGRNRGGRREDIRLPNGRRSLHPGAHRRRFLRGLQPEVHASFVRGLLREGAKPAGMPLPPGLLFDRRWLGAAGSAAGGRCRAWRWKTRTANWWRSAWKEKAHECAPAAEPRAHGHRWRHGADCDSADCADLAALRDAGIVPGRPSGSRRPRRASSPEFCLQAALRSTGSWTGSTPMSVRAERRLLLFEYAVDVPAQLPLADRTHVNRGHPPLAIDQKGGR